MLVKRRGAGGSADTLSVGCSHILVQPRPLVLLVSAAGRAAEVGEGVGGRWWVFLERGDN